jgi:DNA-binding transcriptional ArsR family regulator
MAQLRTGEAPVKDLVAALNISGPALTRHLHMLEDAGLITRGRLAQERPCRLSPQPLREIDEWMESYRQFWADSFDRLDAHLKRVQRTKNKKRKA